MELQENIIDTKEHVYDSDIFFINALLHKVIIENNFKEVVLKFSNCRKVDNGFMAFLCALVCYYRDEYNIVFILEEPTDIKLKKLFKNLNWKYFLTGNSNDLSTYRGYTQIPLTNFKNSDEQFEIVNKIVDNILSGYSHLKREDIAALEWTINELTDNVLNHSDSLCGGFIQYSSFIAEKRMIQIIFADSGVGIPNSLRATLKEIQNDTEALDRAIREGVTRNKNTNQGNGLFGSFHISKESNGEFYIYSGKAKLAYTEKEGLHIQSNKIPVHGSVIVSKIYLDTESLLEKALRFNNIPHHPIDYIELKYEDQDYIELALINETSSFGTRLAAKPLINKIENLLEFTDKIIVLNFLDVVLISSSFADEIVGKLFKKLGPISYMQKIKLINMTHLVKGLIEKTIVQRMQS